ncbi:hypothetical protein DFH11DRAFT_1174286 [Phellopilus nigrolimitatus]|nr:hypothetical protein DFH11DRAFT_1174286 [Phellopilus nigrolimitatus]
MGQANRELCRGAGREWDDAVVAGVAWRGVARWGAGKKRRGSEARGREGCRGGTMGMWGQRGAGGPGGRRSVSLCQRATGRAKAFSRARCSSRARTCAGRVRALRFETASARAPAPWLDRQTSTDSASSVIGVNDFFFRFARIVHVHGKKRHVSAPSSQRSRRSGAFALPCPANLHHIKLCPQKYDSPARRCHAAPRPGTHEGVPVGLAGRRRGKCGDGRVSPMKPCWAMDSLRIDRCH